MPGGQAPKELTPDSGRKLFGLQLRKARQQRGLSMDAFIEEFVGRTRMPVSKASLGRIERGEYLAQPVLPSLLDRFFETKNDLFVDMYELACLESVPHQYQLSANLEQQAVAIKVYCGSVYRVCSRLRRTRVSFCVLGDRGTRGGRKLRSSCGGSVRPGSSPTILRCCRCWWTRRH